MGKILIVKTGSTLPELQARRGDFEDWTLARLGVDAARVVDVTRGERLPDATGFGGVVVTGSHDMVTEHLPWSERTAEWLAGAVARQVPTLAICYGHQLLAYALGGDVNDNPQGAEYGTVEVALAPEAAADPLLVALDRPTASLGTEQCVSPSYTMHPASAVTGLPAALV